MPLKEKETKNIHKNNSLNDKCNFMRCDDHIAISPMAFYKYTLYMLEAK